jgi:hypothetical protein
MKHLKTFEGFTQINEEEGTIGKILGTDKKGIFMEQLEDLKSKGYKVYTKKHATEEEMIEFADRHGYKGKIQYSLRPPLNKTFWFRPEDEINRGSSTSAGLNTGAGGMGYSK